MLISISLFSCTETKKATTTKVDLGKDRIEVLDFYGKHRCESCINIEHHTKAVLDKYYADELKNEEIVFKLIQWDIPENDAIVSKYLAAGTSLIIHRIKDGKEYTDDISDFAFKKSSDEAAFAQGLKERLDAALKKQ